MFKKVHRAATFSLKYSEIGCIFPKFLSYDRKISTNSWDIAEIKLILWDGSEPFSPITVSFLPNVTKVMEVSALFFLCRLCSMTSSKINISNINNFRFYAIIQCLKIGNTQFPQVYGTVGFRSVRVVYLIIVNIWVGSTPC